MDISRVRRIVDLVPLSKRELKPHDYNYLNYRNPDLYRISTSKSLSDSNDLQYLLVHSSRVLRFDGSSFPGTRLYNDDGVSHFTAFYEP